MSVEEILARMMLFVIRVAWVALVVLLGTGLSWLVWGDVPELRLLVVGGLAGFGLAWVLTPLFVSAKPNGVSDGSV